MRFRASAVLVCVLALMSACSSDTSSVAASGAAVTGPAVIAPSTTEAPPTTVDPATTVAATATTAAAPSTLAAVAVSAAPTTVAATPAPQEPPATTVPEPPPPPPPPPPPAPVATGKPCVVSLHGKGGGGQPEWTGSDGVRHSFPAGNAEGWGGLQWLYYPEANYQAVRNIVANDVAAGGCGRVVVYGFSNGAAFAAKLYCRGETFGGKVIGFVIDDPVVDHAVEGCGRPPAHVVIYWTGDVDVPDGWQCGDWTCEGGSAIGIERYQAAIGVVRKPSIHTTHQQYIDPPELHSWF